MKAIRILAIFVLACCGADAKDLSVLTIGNSFSWSLRAYFQKVTESTGNGLYIEYANFGGCPLDRHWDYISQEEASPDKKIYGCGKSKLREILQSRKWDVVTIQQASPKSWDKSTYMPYAKNILNYVRKYAPNAEVVMQQTWSYRADSPRLKEWGFDNTGMYSRLKTAYAETAKELGLKLIPSGDAVQLAREKYPVKFVITPREKFKDFHYPDLPPQAGDPVGALSWVKKNGKLSIKEDLIHLNSYGQYLQACVWFAFLYGEPASSIKFVPIDMSDTDAEFFRKIADEAVSESKANRL